ncbi:predicted protein [Sclerotinia sclerotiorum 1980 UF-70]|uniref:Uncharacterized protein n=1 Tax=Sclerotinia sclerotiorum (strain ATCC 18683 / 1980 / Ss-1) TaxID=665079 RepID=A7F1Z5_SCLS1|nr:predicted protein [Sclerotinia sclerotiorum 1980 UF-70]EDN95737.1 predicted protein [Sclerotinia sclerotiorum 1980 UF-70]
MSGDLDAALCTDDNDAKLPRYYFPFTHFGQLTAIKAALNEVSDWIATSLRGLAEHEQLTDDLNISLKSCHIIILLTVPKVDHLPSIPETLYSTYTAVQRSDSIEATKKAKLGPKAFNIKLLTDVRRLWVKQKSFDSAEYPQKSCQYHSDDPKATQLFDDLTLFVQLPELDLG